MSGVRLSRLVGRLAPRIYRTCGRSITNAAAATATAADPTSGSEASHSGAAVEYAEVTVPDEVLRQFPNELDRRRLEAIAKEYETMRYVSIYCPNHLRVRDWIDIFNMDSAYERIRYYGFLRQTEREKAKERAKKEEARSMRESDDSDNEAVDIQPFNRILQKTNKPKLAMGHASRLAAHIMAGVAPRVVVDMGFLHMMGVSQRNLLFRQLNTMFAMNKTHLCPADLHLVNIDPENTNQFTEHFFSRHFTPTAYGLDPTFHKEDLPQLFSRADIVYLTPDAPTVLHHFDLDRVYVIGGVLKQPAAPVTLAKAKQLGVEFAKLPLDHHVKWVRGQKSLTLPAVLKILLDYISNLGDWRAAIADNVNVRNVRHRDNPLATSRHKQRRLYYQEMLALVPPVPKRSDASGAYEPRITGWKHGKPVYRTDGGFGLDG